MPGPFEAGTVTGIGNPSDVVCVPYSTTSMKLDISGLDASNTVKTQKRTTPGGTFVDQVTYNSNQVGTAIPVVAGEEWRVIGVTMQALKEIKYSMSCQS